jgi:multidrug efflux pump subunit AcrA (membrane-fusion protein)
MAPAIRASDRMLAVEADIPNPGSLRAGLFARAEIVLDAGEPAVCVPERALTSFAGLDKVVVRRDGKAEERTVAIGRRADGWVEILSGLKAEESVVLDPAGLRTGQPLTLDAKAR